MSLPVHCYDGYMKMTLHGVCQVTCIAWKSRNVGDQSKHQWQFLFLLCQHSYWSSRWIYVPAALSSLCPCDLSAAGSVICVVMMQILFFYHLWQSHQWLQSSLNEQYDSNSFHTWAFIDGQPWSTHSDSRPKCSSSRIATLTSLSIMQCGISVHYSIKFMVMHIHGISLSLFVSWLCLDSQSAIKELWPRFVLMDALKYFLLSVW